MHTFPYRFGPALRATLYGLPVLLLVAWLTEGPSNAVFVGAVATTLVIALYQYAYLFNNTLHLAGGKLTIRRRLGRDTEIPLDTVYGFRIEAHRESVFRTYRIMRLRHDAGYTTVNVSDLRDEQAFIRTLEARLGGTGLDLADEDAPEARGFLQRQRERLRG